MEMNFASDKLCESSALVTDKKSIWYITNLESLLMRVDIQTGNIVCMGKLPNSKNKDCAYRTLNYQDGKLFCIPYFTDLLCIYDIEKSVYETVSFPENIKNIIGEELQLFGNFFYKDELIMYGVYPIVIRYNISSRKFKYYFIENVCEKNPKCCFWRDGFEKNNSLYIPMTLYKSIVKINLDNDNITFLRDTNVEECDVIAVKNYKDKIIYVYHKDGKIFLKSFGLDFEKKCEICSFFSDDIFNKNSNAFVWGNIIGSKIILLPWMSLNMYCVDLDSGEFEKVYFASEDDRESKCFCGVIVDQSVFSIVAAEKKLYEFDDMKHILKKLELTISLEEKQRMLEIFEDNMKNGKIMVEQEKIFRIQEFIACL